MFFQHPSTEEKLRKWIKALAVFHTSSYPHDLVYMSLNEASARVVPWALI
jgi:hypothetical protein